MGSKINFFSITIILCLIFSGCKTELNYQQIPASMGESVIAVIEIPAGTNRKVEYNYDRSRFEIDVKDGKERIIDFLPYPGNYGFIPSTFMDPKRGGDGDALDILVIGESLKTGDTISVKLIGTLLLNDSGELDTKIIAVPADPTKRTMHATDFQSFSVEYSAARNIIENWFLNYKGLGVTEFLGWRNDRYALQEIEKWRVADE